MRAFRCGSTTNLRRRIMYRAVSGLAALTLRATAVCACVLFASALASAQGTSAIAGVVRDTTGAVLPGVTVEAGSPALIEKVRTVVTDSQGQYRIVDLPPGSYRVTFTLPGFTGLTRQGIELSSGFTATINAQLTVGDVAETITVSGQTPLVDVQNTKVQQVL